MISWHKADSLRMLPSGPDLVQIAYSTRSPANQKSTIRQAFFKSYFCVENLHMLTLDNFI